MAFNPPLPYEICPQNDYAAWYDMINSIVSFVSASTQLASTLRSNSVYFSDNLDAIERKKSLEEVNLDDFPWFLRAISEEGTVFQAEITDIQTTSFGFVDTYTFLENFCKVNDKIEELPYSYLNVIKSDEKNKPKLGEFEPRVFTLKDNQDILVTTIRTFEEHDNFQDVVCDSANDKDKITEKEHSSGCEFKPLLDFTEVGAFQDSLNAINNPGETIIVPNQAVSKDSCFFEDFTDSEQTIDSCNLQEKFEDKMESEIKLNDEKFQSKSQYWSSDEMRFDGKEKTGNNLSTEEKYKVKDKECCLVFEKHDKIREIWEDNVIKENDVQAEKTGDVDQERDIIASKRIVCKKMHKSEQESINNNATALECKVNEAICKKRALAKAVDKKETETLSKECKKPIKTSVDFVAKNKISSIKPTVNSERKKFLDKVEMKKKNAEKCKTAGRNSYASVESVVKKLILEGTKNTATNYKKALSVDSVKPKVKTLNVKQNIQESTKPPIIQKTRSNKERSSSTLGKDKKPLEIKSCLKPSNRRTTPCCHKVCVIQEASPEIISHAQKDQAILGKVPILYRTTLKMNAAETVKKASALLKSAEKSIVLKPTTALKGQSRGGSRPTTAVLDRLRW